MKIIKKNDIIYITCLILAICIFSFVLYSSFKTNTDKVLIEYQGEKFGTYSLNENRQININDENIVEINDGKVYMKYATCNDQICVKHKAISTNLQSIVCLPNKVVVSLVSSNVSDIDVVS